MEDDEQKTVKPSTTTAKADSGDVEPDASKLRKMSMSQDNSAKLAKEQFR